MPSRVLITSPPIKSQNCMDCPDCLTTCCFIDKSMAYMPGRYLDRSRIAWTDAPGNQ